MNLTCPDTGTLRAYLDGEAPEATGAHVGGCQHCTAELQRLRADAEEVTRALALLAPPEPALVGDGGRRTDDLAERRRTRERRRAWTARTRRAVAAVAGLAVGIAALGTAPGREAAASFLAQFRSERIQVVAIDPYGQRNPLLALGALGEIRSGHDVGIVMHATTVAEARRRTGLAVHEPSPGVLPQGFAPQPSQVLVHQAGEVRLEFDEARVRAWLEAHSSDLAVPEGIGDTVLRVDVPPAVALVYRGHNWEELVVGEAGMVTADTDGPVSLEELHGFLLDLPGLDPDTVEQLRAIDDWRTTLPLPVPLHDFDWHDTTVGGAPAVGLRGTSGFGAAILWQAGGQVHGVGGLVSEDVARQIAEEIAR